MEWYVWVLTILGGFAAGFINTLAGSGSLITLPILIFLGLPANVANGTNRVGALLQTVVSVITFKRRGNFDLKGSQWLIFPAVLGSIPGALIAVDLNDDPLCFGSCASVNCASLISMSASLQKSIILGFKLLFGCSISVQYTITGVIAEQHATYTMS